VVGEDGLALVEARATAESAWVVREAAVEVVGVEPMLVVVEVESTTKEGADILGDVGRSGSWLYV
jgi:hypothetical protein